MSRPFGRATMVLAALTALAACERPPIETVQTGYRGLAQEQNANPRLLEKRLAEHAPPPAIPAVAPGPPAPAGTFKNVKVLTELSVAELTRTMIAMSNWVAPKEQCAFCHNPANMASDEKYQKVVARQMLKMTRDINRNYSGHVAATGVTCYTCHAGNHVPQGVWYYTNVNQYLRHFLDRPAVRVQSGTVLAREDSNRSSIRQTENTYALMVRISNSLGVNCTYCHNSRQWSSWDESSPKRLVALRGLRMVRSLNTEYLVPLQSVWPASGSHAPKHLDPSGTLMAAYRTDSARLGPMGDGGKLQCATCHQGVYKPMFGAAIAKDYPALMPPEGSPSPAAPDSMARPAPVDSMSVPKPQAARSAAQTGEG